MTGEWGEVGPDNNYFRNYKMVIKSVLLIALFLRLFVTIYFKSGVMC